MICADVFYAKKIDFKYNIINKINITYNSNMKILLVFVQK